jgi:hypothetical protein
MAAQVKKKKLIICWEVTFNLWERITLSIECACRNCSPVAESHSAGALSYCQHCCTLGDVLKTMISLLERIMQRVPLSNRKELFSHHAC